MESTHTHSCNVDTVCVEAFAKITASMSHEIKNVLAIINENGGLLEDLALMAGEQGVPSARVIAATATIARQVSRANTIMRNINRFSHLGDTPVSEESLAEMLRLTVALADRQLAMKCITHLTDCPPELRLHAPMHGLVTLLYLILRGLAEICDSGSELSVTGAVGSTGSGTQLQVVFGGGYRLGRLVELPNHGELQLLLDFLGVEAVCTGGTLELTIPRS